MRPLFFLIAVMLAAEASGQDHQQWRNITNNSFSFSIPAPWKKTDAHGIDSFVEEYLGPGIKLSFDFRSYSNNFGGWPKETKFEELKINGKTAWIGTAKREFHDGYPYSTQVYMKEDTALSMFAACKSEKEVALARKVFETIVLHDPTTDEARYQQWHRAMDSWGRVVFVERHISSSLSKVLNLPALEQSYMDKDEAIYEELHASGYLTNVHIAVSNAGTCRAQITDRLRKATQGSGAKWEFIVRSNAVVVLTCRPQDVGLCVRAVKAE